MNPIETALTDLLSDSQRFAWAWIAGQALIGAYIFWRLLRVNRWMR